MVLGPYYTEEGKTSDNSLSVRVEYFLEQNMERNATLVDTNLQIKRNVSSGGIVKDPSANLIISINGYGVFDSSDGIDVSNYTPNVWYTVGQGLQGTFTHEEDGTMLLPTFTIHGQVYSTSSSSNWSMYSWEEVQIPNIIRGAFISETTNFTDEENLTIKYSNSVPNETESLQVGISLTKLEEEEEENLIIPYRTVPGEIETFYSFSLTDVDRTALRIATQNLITCPVYVRIKTERTDGLFAYHEKEATLTIINTEPEINVSVTEANDDIYAITQDRNLFVKGYSHALATISATPKKEAILSDYIIINGNEVWNESVHTFENIENPNFIFKVTDSRHGVIPTNFECNLIPYFPLTCELTATPPTMQGTLSLQITGQYYNGNIGNTINELIIEYRYKEKNGEYSDWISVAVDNNNSEYSTDTTIEGLDYKKTYILQARAKDTIIRNDEDAIITPEKVLIAVPIFDWGEHDLRVQVETNINGNMTVAGSTNINGEVSIEGTTNINGNTNINGAFTINGNPIEIKPSDIVDIIYPIGSIYMSVNDISPSILFGGNWERLKDTFLLAAGDTYANGTNGGNSKHTHTLNNGYTKVNANGTTLRFIEKTVPAWYSNGQRTFASMGTSQASQAYGWALGGTTDEANNMPPYLAVYMWKRIEDAITE